MNHNLLFSGFPRELMEKMSDHMETPFIFEEKYGYLRSSYKGFLPFDFIVKLGEERELKIPNVGQTKAPLLGEG